MHILFITSGPMTVNSEPYANIFQYEQAKAMSENGHTVGIISVGYITLRHFAKDYSYKSIEKFNNLLILRKYLRTLFIERFLPADFSASRYLKIFNNEYYRYVKLAGVPDVVFAHNFLFAGYLANSLWEKFAIPFGITEHSSAYLRDMVPKSFNHILTLVASNASFLTCVSSSLSKELSNRVEKSFLLLPNLVDSRFIQAPFNHKNNNEVFTFISVGSLDENKNHSLIINAFAKSFKGTTTHLKIIGNGPLYSYLQNLIKSIDIQEQVTLLGALSRDAVCDQLINSDCFVSSSNFETFGVALIEATACGLPLISTRSGGPNDIVNKDNGVLIDIGSEHQMIEALNYMRLNNNVYDKYKLRSDTSAMYAYSSFSNKIFPLFANAITK